tara:strand:- start:1002 stop:1238 length:237 start_codon:yes stop_codon:yes gene_type:complete
MDIDFKIIEAEFQIESKFNPYGHFIALRFIDVVPSKPKLWQAIEDLTKHQDVELIDWNYKEVDITSKTSLKHFDVTIN